MPPVSVIMAVHNEDQYVSEAIESILCQTFKDFEFIITDDASKFDPSHHRYSQSCLPMPLIDYPIQFCKRLLICLTVGTFLSEFLNHEISGDLINASHIHDSGLFVGNYHYNIQKELHHLYETLDKL